jgi:hypothetical protein
MLEQPRVMLVANETRQSFQRSSRRTLTQLQAAGVIAGLSVYSLRLRGQETTRTDALRGLLSRIESFRPEIVIMQHPVGTGIDSYVLGKMRSVCPFSLIYYEGDPYSRYRHPLPSEAQAVAAAADAVVTVGDGQFRENFLRAGARRVEWSASRYDPWSFGTQQIPLDKQYEVVMIANRSNPRLPFRALPGARDRIKLVEQMQKQFGSSFGLFGAGWEGPSARGPLPFWQQESAIASASISVNWDHYPKERKYFSNRLPISLASGTVHVTGVHPGYDEIFDDNEFIHFCRSPMDVVDRVRTLLNTVSREQFYERASAGRRWASDNLRADEQIASWLKLAGLQVDSTTMTEATKLEVQPSTEI